MGKKALAAGDVVQAKEATKGVDVGDIGVVVDAAPDAVIMYPYKVAWGANSNWVTWCDREQLRRGKVMGKGVRVDVSGWA
jgi:hypothetical protein